MSVVMRTLMTLITTLTLTFVAAGCSRDREDTDICGRAIANAERLVDDHVLTRERFGDRPFDRDDCRRAPATELTCAAYASDWSELEGCAPVLLH